MKRFGALLLILCMLAGMLCVSAFTDAPETAEEPVAETEPVWDEAPEAAEPGEDAGQTEELTAEDGETAPTLGGVTDTGDGQIVRKTTTNYFTTVIAAATATNSVTGETITFAALDSGELAGNISDENVQAVIEDYKARILAWAGSLGTIEDNKIMEGVASYYYDAHDEITESKGGAGGSDVILVGDPDDLDRAYVAQGTLTVETILNKHQTYRLTGTITYAPFDVIPAFADEQMVTVGKGDFEAPHYFDLAKGELATGTAAYNIGESTYASDAELKAFLAAQSVGAVINCDFAFQGSGDYAGFSHSGTLTFTMVAAVDTAAITITAPKTGSALATSATVAGTAGGVSVDKDCLPVQSVVWSPADTTAAAETVYKVTITIQADRGVDLADTVSATVNGAAAGSSVSDGVLTVAYTFPATEPAETGKPTETEKPAETSDYYYLNGENSTWAEGNSDLYFRVNGDYDKFTSVKVDGKLIDEANYTSASGSTVVNLKASYLAALSEGKHTLTVVYNDGEVSTDFTVKKAAPAQTTTSPTATDKPAVPDGAKPAISPKTGDGSHIVLWAVMLGASMLGLGVVLNRKRKEN